MRLVANALYLASLDDGPVHIAEVALAYLSGHVGEVEVGVSYLACVDVLTEIRVSGVGSTEANGVLIAQLAVATLSCAGTS